jgi:nitrate/TMAO reductase-like tetraheme cytochrome c subunit
MTTESPSPQTPQSSWRNWTSLSGLVVMAAAVFSFFFLFALDAMAHFSNPYVGLLTYLLAPGFILLGFVVFVVGIWLRRRKLGKMNGGGATPLKIDLSRPRDRKILGVFIVGTACFLLVTSITSYHSYHYTESVQFCGQTCHTVMQPELVSYQHSPHARVACAECHIGQGATWYVRSKLSGTYQVYATLTDKFPRPVPTPIKNLRPAQETCEQCHWPKKFVGNLDRSYHYFLTDKDNPAYSVRLLLKVGGGDPTYGPVGDIHWHMNVANTIEYIATDSARQKIPWVRMTDSQGVVTEFRTAAFTNGINAAAIRRMDCMDCHNRPAHRLQTPNSAVNQAIALGKIDRSLPSIKSNAVYVLTQTNYTSELHAKQMIATTLANAYPNEPRIRRVIDTVQQIYSINFFPEMKADWRAYPDNIGHKDFNGCFRCHDGKHKTADGKRTIKANDCNACHIILAQGSGPEFEQLHPHGQKFKHPGDDIDEGFLCTDCHSGGL